MVSVTRLISTKSSSDSDSSSSDSEDAGPKQATYHQWRSYLMKMDSHKNGTANTLRNGASTPLPTTCAKPITLAPKYTRTVVQAIKNVNTVPRTSKGIQTVTPELSASLRSIYETFWSLNSAAKLIHVKSQLDEPSKIYVHKLIKAHSNLVQENSRLKKEKQDLINVIKKIGIAISNETIANLLDPARPTQPKNS